MLLKWYLNGFYWDMNASSLSKLVCYSALSLFFLCLSSSRITSFFIGLILPRKQSQIGLERWQEQAFTTNTYNYESNLMAFMKVYYDSIIQLIIT